MNEILTAMVDAYKSAYKNRGVHSPITNDIRQLIFRHFQREGQQIIMQTNRELTETANEKVESLKPDSEKTPELRPFIHPKSLQPKKVMAATVTPEAGSEPPQTLGRLGRTQAAKDKVQDKQNQHTSPPKELKTPVVDDADLDDAPQEHITEKEESEQLKFPPLTAQEIGTLAEMDPGDIARKFSVERMLATLQNIGSKVPKATTRAAKVAAMLKSATQ